MPVTVEKIKERLKIKYPKANLSTKRIDAIAAKLANKPADGAEDEAVDLVLEDFNSILSFEEIAREDDRTRTLEANQKKSNEPPTPPVPPVDPPTPPKDDAPEWAKGIVESNRKLLEEVEALKTGKITETKKQTAAQLFEKSEVLKGLKEELKPRWINRIDINSETSIEDQIKDLESEYSELVQVSADSNQYAGPAGSGDANNKPDAAVVDEIVSSLTN